MSYAIQLPKKDFEVGLGPVNSQF